MESKAIILLIIVVTCNCKHEDDKDNIYKILDQLRLEIKDLKKVSAEQRAEIDDQRAEIDDQRYEINGQRVEINEQRAKLQRLSELLSTYKGKGGNTDRPAKRILLNEFGNLPGYQKEGAIYIRWGSTTCPSNGTETVYSGMAGGSLFSHTGGAVEYICLPPDPKYGIQVNEPAFGYLYGAEYQTNYFGPAEDQDVPCAVCRSTTGYSTLMIPARNQCYPGWKREYHGRLASGAHNHEAASQFVCVDAFPDVLYGGSGNQDGKLFYPVKSECGSLKCPPYANDKEVLCVVCTR